MTSFVFVWFANAVHFLNSARVVANFTIKGSEIIDLDILPHQEPIIKHRSTTVSATTVPLSAPSAPASVAAAVPVPKTALVEAPTAFVDPAIVSAAPIRQSPSTTTKTTSYGQSSDESSVDSNPYTAAPTKLPLKTKKKRSANQRSANQRRERFNQPVESDGWATEDVTDIKDTEFDFQANLNLFDKKTVFNQIRENDKTAPADRLVAFNKMQPKYGNKEMIVQSDSNWDFSDLQPTESNMQQLRKGSTTGVSSRLHFVAVNTLKQCPCASPVQMVELERITCETFGLSEPVVHENAGRGIAQLAIRSLGGSSRFNMRNHNSRPLVVTLAGDNKAGCRALAASRHLSNRQVQVVAVVPGKERHVVKGQVKAFESAGGKVVSRMEQLTAVLNSYDIPPELVIDGLQGYHSTFEDMFDDEVMTTVLGLIEWANRQKGGIMSLDIPSGLDSSTGLPCSLNQFVHAKSVVSCGFPLTGNLNARLAEVVGDNDWQNYVVDVGFPKAALQASGMRRFEKIWFGADWLVELAIQRQS
jgi:enhancer of mRNA-decapping protein 3